MYSHPERIRQALASAPGTAGDLVLGAARVGYAALGAAHDGKSFVVTLQAGVDWEVRRDCVYTHATATLTRGTLVASSSGAAVDLPGTTIMRVGPSGYEADRLLPADLDGSGNALRLRDGNANPFALLPLDANGNVIATIAHRQNTLANLLALDGLAGEISVATDQPTVVLHNGVAGQARTLDDSFKRVGTDSYRGGLTSDTLAGALGSQAFDIQASRSVSSRYAAGVRSVAIGNDNQLSSPGGVAIGTNLVDVSTASWNVLIGKDTGVPATSQQCISIGSLHAFGGNNLRCTAVGGYNLFAADSQYSVGIGSSNTIGGAACVAIGQLCTADNGGTVEGTGSVAMGYMAVAHGGIALGNASTIDAAALGYCGAIGYSCSVPATGNYSFACGNVALAGGDHLTMVAGGDGYSSTAAYAATLGATEASTAASCYVRASAREKMVTIGGTGGCKIRVPTSAEYTTHAQTLTSNGYMNFERVSNTQLRVHVRGDDGVVRHADLTLVP